MPANILPLGDGRALVNTCGYHDHSLNLIDLSTGRVISTLPFTRSWVGLARAADGTILISGGKADSAKYPALHRVTLDGDRLRSTPELTLPAMAQIPPEGRFVSNLLSGPKGLYVLNVQTDEVFLVAPDGSEKARAKVGYRPYAAALSPDGATLAVSEWGGKTVALLDAETLERKTRVAVGSHPTALNYLPDGRLAVANAGSDTLSLIEFDRVTETVRTGLGLPERIGSTPLALTVASDGKTVYVANAGDNLVTVLDVARRGSARVKGLIPTSRYPSAVALTPDGKRLLIGTAKGDYGPNAATDPKNPIYIGNQLQGRLTILDVPTDADLRAMTRSAREGVPLGIAQAPGERERRNVERTAFAHIQHVIYVIKENRTYDQILGDDLRGNGEPRLTMYGARITPNEHRLAHDFGLLDNLYTDGEVSQVGHQWTDAAYANDYTEKAWILSYSGHGEVESDARLTSSPGEYLWTQARKSGKTARVYGEYVDVQEDHGSLLIPKIKADPEAYGYSATFEKIFARGGRDPEKVADFLREMREAERTGEWPNLMVMALPEDHTRGLRAGALTPEAMVGSNDLAVGQLVDGVSHSKFWGSTAIFIIEDDAQNGPDHVDSHRTTGFVISPWVRRGFVDSTMYTTSSMLRTMETILGLPPMTTYDANATPMHALFTTKPSLAPWVSLPATTDLNAKNPSGTALARRSAKLDLSDIDRADEGELNRILWTHAKPGQPYPVRNSQAKVAGRE